ncbi:MAG: FecR domain-containing protein [Gammaproteobacteria bacterium]|nr:FecR domain-containing protein [Gammaproteobacteria bacterium]MDH3411637.1 FecR domain-containing protein [Gammaproteobacteria bacterium]
MRVTLPNINRLLAALCFSALQFPHAGAQDFEYAVQPGDTLIEIGKQWLADPARWRRLVKPNRISDPNYILPGRKIRIPLRLLKTEAEQAEVVRVQGVAETEPGQNVSVGDEIREGSELRTGAKSYVTLQLADGSQLTLPANSAVRIEQLKRFSNTDVRVSRLRIIAGRIEAFIRKLRGPGSQFQLDSPVAVIGIRGTDFRGGTDEKGKALRAEVLDGRVALNSVVSATAGTVLINTGFGAVADESGKLSAPVALPAEPNLENLPTFFERPLVRFRLESREGVRAHRLQLASDASFRKLVRDEIVSGADVRFADLPDGQYYLRVRAIDALALEGHDAQHSFRLKARPEPPFTSKPANRSKLRATGAEFAWTATSEAASYHFQLARDERFMDLVSEAQSVAATSRSVADLKPGEYFWRMASIRADGDHGPFGDTQRFNLFPLPATPAPPSEKGNSLVFSWSSEPMQTFEFQIALDEKFANVVTDLKVAEPTVVIPRPDSGRYFMRVRAIDADGFVGPYTTTQTFELHDCLVVAATGQCVESSVPGQKWLLR